MATPEEQRREARERTREIEVAFVTVFGEDGKRTRHQQIVWDWFTHVGYAQRPLVYPSPTGTIDPLQLATNAGAHSIRVKIAELILKGSLPENPINHPQPIAVRE